MKKLRWLVTKEDAEYMRMRKAQNLALTFRNKNENWFADLIPAHLKYSRQAIWGRRLFDFWFGFKGIAVEIDGPEHNSGMDAYRDEYNFRRSAIVVIRVQNGNQKQAEFAINFLESSDTLSERKSLIGGSSSRHWIARQPYPPSFLSEYIKTKRVPSDTPLFSSAPQAPVVCP